MKLNIGKHWIEGMFLLVGAVIGVVGTYFYTVGVEEQKLYLEDRKAGYTELFDGTVALRRYWDTKASADDERTKGNESKAKELESEAHKQNVKHFSHYDRARFKIGVFGDADVVHALAKYWGAHFNEPPCGNRQQMLDEVAIYQAMRRSMGARGQVEDKDLILVLFKCIVKEGNLEGRE
jgi:hypothetical protein